jgi:diguanylate cyclase (GGDEF)-like protein/PAS domain S-box-containing protein
MQQFGWGFGFSVAGALMGGASVRLAHRRESSARKKREQQSLDRKQQQFLALAEASADAFYILDSVRDIHGKITDFTFRYLNLHASRRLDGKNEGLVGASYRECMGAFLSDLRFDQYCEVVATGTPLTVEFPVSLPDCNLTWVRHQVFKIDDGIVITSTDLSELKAVQERFQSVTQFNDTIFAHAPFSIITTDAAGKITAVNPQAETLTGYTSAELIGSASLLQLLDPDELRQRSELLFQGHGVRVEGIDVVSGVQAAPEKNGSVNRGDAAHAGERPHERPCTDERPCTFVRRDGTRIPVKLSVKVCSGQDGERTGLIAIASDATASKLAATAVAPAPTRDTLTGLVGPGLLEDRITQAIKRASRTASKTAVLTIDIDHFQRINDALGHRIGDDILTTAAARLLEKVRSADTVARIGADEFIVVISDQAKISDIEFCASLFLNALCAPYEVQGHTVNVTASVGICVCPDLADDAERLLRRSEAAMYAAKEAGRNRIMLFADDMLEDAASRLSMEGALRQALHRNELYLEYQPQVELPSGKVIGMEALMRWNHPRLGLVSPAHFIPIAEKIGLLPEFGAWAMNRACHEAKWIQTRLNRRVSLSVNLSPSQFQQNRVLHSIQEALRTSGLDAADLEVEIIESTLMVNSTANLETLQLIRDLGVRLSIDDFGTGFCNFNYLLQYQVDRLKIDQSFVRQAANDGSAASVVRTVIAMSHGLGIKVIAEGVETREQLKFLMRRRCDQAQGFFFARAISAEQFVEAVPTIEAMNLSDHSGEHSIEQSGGRKAVSGASPSSGHVQADSGSFPSLKAQLSIPHLGSAESDLLQTT